MLEFHRRALPPETLNDTRRPIYENRIRTSDVELRAKH